jgi:hypothetical protein
LLSVTGCDMGHSWLVLLRVEFDGALYHVTSRGNAREDIFDGDRDRQAKSLGTLTN